MRRHALVGLIVLIAGCATAPPAAPPVLSVTVPTTWTARPDTGTEPTLMWWTDFGDPALDEVVAAALEQNYDLPGPIHAELLTRLKAEL